MGTFHESRQIVLQHTERREVWCLAAVAPLPNTNSPPLLEAIANQNEMHPLDMAKLVPMEPGATIPSINTIR